MRRIAWVIGAMALLGWMVPVARAAEAKGKGGAHPPGENSCEACHRNPDFMVTNKKLYDYYQQWRNSIHRQEGVDCDDCHGGNPRAKDKTAAHGDGVGASDPSSGIYYANVPETCGTCHENILEGFRTSLHYEHVKKQEGEKQGPTCVTCHGSIDSEVLKVTTVVAACARCHNEETGNHPENPEKAREILSRFLSIHRFYRYITVRADPEEARVFFRAINDRMEHLSVTWHTFDLEKIEDETELVLTLMKAKRDEIRNRDAQAKQQPE